MKPPSNATEIPLAQVSLNELQHCDGCNYYSAGKRFRYTWQHEETPPTVMPTRVRSRDIQLCRGCSFAYGPTIEARGYKLEK